MILVTAATGMSGRQVIAALRARGQEVRALARSQAVEELRADGVETVAADMLDRAALRRAFDGVEAVVFIGPSFNPMEAAMGQAVIDAARVAGVGRFVQFSVSHPQIDFLTNHRAKLEVEDHLVNSGLDFTILQPMHYMQNVDPVGAAADGVLRVPFRCSVPRSFVDLEDVAEVAAIVLTEGGHSYATYPLCGPDLMTEAEVAATIGSLAGVEVRCEELAIADLVAAISAGGPLHPIAIDGIYRLFTYYSLHGLVGNPNVLGWLLGREPRTVREYVERCLDSGAAPPPPAWVDSVRSS